MTNKDIRNMMEAAKLRASSRDRLENIANEAPFTEVTPKSGYEMAFETQGLFVPSVSDKDAAGNFGTFRIDVKGNIVNLTYTTKNKEYSVLYEPEEVTVYEEDIDSFTGQKELTNTTNYETLYKKLRDIRNIHERLLNTKQLPEQVRTIVMRRLLAYIPKSFRGYI